MVLLRRVFSSSLAQPTFRICPNKKPATSSMRDHRRVSVSAAHGERACPRGVSDVERVYRLAEQNVSGGIFQRNAILRAPADMIGLRLDQMVGGENLADLVEHQRRHAYQRQRLAVTRARSN